MRRLHLLARSLRTAGAVAALLGAASPLAAQSLFANRGLGLLVDPQSARSYALGGVSLGLPGGEISWTNPAGAVGLPAAGLLVAFQYDDFAARFGGRTAEGTVARFPLVLGAFPFGEKWAVTAGFAGFLDQTGAVEQADTLLIGTDTVPVLDRFSSEGGVSRLRLGAAYRVVPTLSVGLGVDVFTGGVRRVSGRLFPGEVEPRCCRAEWEYSGLGYLASLDWSPTEAVSFAASAAAGGSLDAQPVDSPLDTDTAATPAVPSASYDVPLQLNAGASARVAADLLVAVGASWTGWSTLDTRLARAGGARDSWSVQGGLETDAIQVGERAVPLRLGGRYRTLPFRGPATAAGFAAERAITGGLGIVLAGGAANTDVTIERGWRGGEAAGLDESFWRLVFSVSVLGQ